MARARLPSETCIVVILSLVVKDWFEMQLVLLLLISDKACSSKPMPNIAVIHEISKKISI